MSQESLDFAEKGLKPSVQWLLWAFLAVLLLIADAKFSWGDRVRSTVLLAVAPVQTVLSAPVRAWREARFFLTRQSALVRQNQFLLRNQTVWAARWRQKDLLERENRELKTLLQLKQRREHVVAVAEIISVGNDAPNARFTLDKGTNDGVMTGQAVIDGQGLVGQITSVSADYALMTPVTGQNFVIPVMVSRTGFRTLIYGDAERLDLRYFPTYADLRPGDLLVTSGLDSNYPAGIPVAGVSRIELAEGLPYYTVEAETVGQPESARYVLILPKRMPFEADIPVRTEPTP